jgi:hypothetical protein
MMRCLLLLGICAVANPIFDHQAEQPIRTTICAIKGSPSLFNGRLVEVSGYATHGADNSMFEDPTCFWSKDNPGIWMEYGGSTGAAKTKSSASTAGGADPKLVVVQGMGVVLTHNSTFEHFDKLLHSVPGKDVSVRATVRARFFVTPEMADGKLNTGKGYGKRGCCMLFAIEQVTAVESTAAEPSIFELAKPYTTHKP